ncbi:MAG: glycosyltransferase [Nitrososphaerota archaeon]|nr:glycosyltransferase [Nitrososphaerota archaeon]
MNAANLIIFGLGVYFLIWLLIVWLGVGLLFLGVPGIYFIYMKRCSKGTWGLCMDSAYLPSVAIFVPVYNEQAVIGLKLENLSKVVYPRDKVEIIIVNDSSSDNTLKIINQYLTEHPIFKITLFDSNKHLGKTGCLNQALKTVQSDIVIISDADCFWPTDILQKALFYLSDPNVGAITARELLLNPGDTWVTLTEQFYDSTIQLIRVGESKVHSTLFFQGGFAAYKRGMLKEFNSATDDSGTALDIIQNNKRTLLIPEIGFFTVSPTVWRDKFSMKIRRANHLQQLWARCLWLMFQGKLVMPKRIAVPESFLHLFNPLLLVILTLLTAGVMIVYPTMALIIPGIFCLLLIVKKTRLTALELIQNNLILLVALSTFLTKRKFKFWKPVTETRSVLSAQVLREKKLI